MILIYVGKKYKIVIHIEGNRKKGLQYDWQGLYADIFCYKKARYIQKGLFPSWSISF